MFYAHFVLSKKGPLAKVWLAAHWDKKLTKAHVFETNINNSVQAILQPKVKMALRTSGHLLLGVVRIYSRKAKYLLADCNEAFVKIKMAFRPGMVDLPSGQQQASVAAITLPETFHDFESTMADLADFDVQAQLSVNQSKPEDITMKEDLGTISFNEFGGGDMEFDDSQMLREDFDENFLQPYSTADKMDIGGAGADDDLGQYIGDDDPNPADDLSSDDDNNDDLGNIEHADLIGADGSGFMTHETGNIFEDPAPPSEPPKDFDITSGPSKDTTVNQPNLTTITDRSAVPDQTTLVTNDREAFALEPLDVTSVHGGVERRTKRKRRLIVDEQKGISSETMKLQLSDTTDISTSLDLAPPTKRLMLWKETGGVEKLFALSADPICSKNINQHFINSMVTRAIGDDDDDIRNELQVPAGFGDIETVRNRNSVRSSINDRSLADVERVRHDSSVLSVPNIDQDTTIQRSREDESLAQISDLPLINETLDTDVDINAASVGTVEDIFDMALDSVAPPSVGGDSIGGEENEEEQEERRWGKRTHQLIRMIDSKMDYSEKLLFSSLLLRNNRKQVASKFYTLLVLKKNQAINIEQDTPFGELVITRGQNFQSCMTA